MSMIGLNLNEHSIPLTIPNDASICRRTKTSVQTVSKSKDNQNNIKHQLFPYILVFIYYISKLSPKSIPLSPNYVKLISLFQYQHIVVYH